jgi:hypothetical protein
MIWSLWRAAPKLALEETHASGFDADGRRGFPP